MKITKNRKHTVTAGRTARARQFGIKAARVGKTKMVYVLQGNYGYGWDDLCEYDRDQYGECKADLKAYRENQPANYRIIQRRVPNPDYKETPVEQSTSSKRKYTVKASSDSYSMADYDVVIYRNSEKVYSGSVYDYSFNTTIKNLCKNSENLRVFTEWLRDYGVSDIEDSDIPALVIEMITSDWEEATESDEDFYEEISMYGYQHSDVRFEVFYAKDEVKASTATQHKYTVKASKSAKRKKRVMAGYTMPYTKWVFDGDDGQWKMWGGANTPTVDADFLDKINHPNYPNPEYNVENNYTDVVVLPAGGTPDDGRPVKANSCTSAKNIYAEDGYSDEDNARFEREQFAERIVHEIEDEYSIKISDDAWGTIMNLAADLSFGADAHKHGSDPMWVLEDTIYDIFEEDTGVVIGSSKVSRNVVTAASDTAVSTEDVDELVLYITNDGDLYRGRASSIIKNLKRKAKNGNYDKELAVKAWQYLADDGVRKYDKEFGSGRGSVAWLNPATRKAIATELRDYYEEEIFYDDSVTSSMAINASSDIDVDEIKSIIRNAGISVLEVTCSRIHTGDIYKVLLDNPDDASVAIDAIRDSGFTVTFDTMDGNNMFVFIEDNRLENAYLYRVSFEYTSEIVRMDDETGDYQAVLDTCIDQMEADGKTGYLYTADEVEAQGWGADEYVEGGNHGWLLYTGGNFNIEPLGWSDEAGNITASVATNHNSPITYNTDSKRDAEYLNALCRGVVKELTQSVGDTTVYGGGDFIYEISDSAITFMASGDGTVLYIQPLDHIEPNMDDLETDIEELCGAIYSEIMPKF